MDLSNYMLIDISTGTVLTAEHCVLVHSSDLSASEWEELDTMSDSETGEIGRERGKPLTAMIPEPLDFTVVSALGDLLEQAQERLDKALHMLDAEDAQREMDALDKLWSHYQQLLE